MGDYKFDWLHARLPAFPNASADGTDGRGALSFSYLDSGEPAGGGGGYTTVVCIHGHTYTARAFSHALRAAQSAGSGARVRLIAPNRRDYAPTTLLTPAELKQIFATDTPASSFGPGDGGEVGAVESHRAFLRARAFELARFLAWVRDNALGKGGLAVLGWSLGTVSVLSLLALLREPNLVPEAKVELRRVFLFELLPTFTGHIPPPTFYDPFSAASNSPEVALAIDTWLRSYCAHPCFVDELKARPAGTDKEPILVRDDDIDGEEAYYTGLPNAASSGTDLLPRPSTSFSPQLSECLDLTPGPRSEIALYTCVARETFSEQLRVAFTDEQGVEGPPITIAYGGASIWAVPWSARRAARDFRRWNGPSSASSYAPTSRQRFDIVRVPGANHFMVWDEPERFVGMIAACLEDERRAEQGLS